MSKNETLLHLVNAGMSNTAIAKALSVSRKTVYNIKKRFAESGDVRRKSGQGRPRSVRTPALVRSVKAKIKRNPVRSIRKMAKEAGVSATTLRRLVNDDLNCKSRARTKKHLINQKTTATRLKRSRILLNIIKHTKAVILFTDEKVFTVDAISNSRIDRYISSDMPKDVPDNVKYTFRTKHPQSVMMFGLVASDGRKMPPFFFQQGQKVDSKTYIQLLETQVKPWIEANYPLGTDYIFQQDGAPCHTSRKTQSWLVSNLTSFWDKEKWPPSSPDLNPLDYSVWAFVERGACSKPHKSVQVLKSAIVKAWDNMDEDYIKNTCAAFRGRVEAVIMAGGGHIE